jgi:hypothetical protein
MHILFGFERLISLYELKNKSDTSTAELFLVLRDKTGKHLYKAQSILDLDFLDENQ